MAVNSYNITRWVVRPSDFKVVVGDGISAADATLNCQKMQAAWDFSVANNRTFVHDSGPIEIGNELKTRSGFTFERKGASSWLKARWTPGSTIPWLNQSKAGGFITNVFTSASALTVQNRIRFIDPWIDGALITQSDLEEIGTARGGSATTIQFATSASAVDDWYVGKLVQLFSGTGSPSTGLHIVTAYVGATRTATCTGTWTTPDTTTLYAVGTNTNGIGGGVGVSDFMMLGGIVQNFPPGILAAGGKGFSMQQGSIGTIVDGATFINCHFGIMQQGWTGSNANGALRANLQDSISNCIMRNCGAALAYFGGTPAEDPFVGSMASMSANISNITAINCGNLRVGQRLGFVDLTRQKSGVFCFASGHNVSARNLRAYNDIAPVYPTDYSSRIGYSLTGNTGALVWLGGRSVSIDGLYAEGSYDALVRVNRLRAMGADGPSASSGTLTSNFKNVIKNVNLRGNVDNLLYIGEILDGYQPTDANLSLDIQAEIEGTINTGIFDTRLAAYQNTRADLTVRDEATGSFKRITGTAGQIYTRGNTVASFPDGLTFLDKTSTEGAPGGAYKTGFTYSTFAGTPTLAVASAIDTLYFYPFLLQRRIVVTGGVVRTGTGGAGSSIKAGIWANNDAGTTNRPVGAPLLVDNTGASTASSTANVALAMSGTLQPGLYWVGVKLTGTLPTTLGVGSNNQTLAQLAGVTGNALNAYAVSIADTYSNAMPTIPTNQTFTQVATGTIPILGLTA